MGEGGGGANSAARPTTTNCILASMHMVGGQNLFYWEQILLPCVFYCYFALL